MSVCSSRFVRLATLAGAFSLALGLSVGSTSAAPKGEKETAKQKDGSVDRSRRIAPSLKKVLKSTSKRPKVELMHDRSLRKRAASIKKLTKKDLKDALDEMDVAIETNQLETPAVLDVRDPHHDDGTHVSFIGSVAVLPGEEGGIANIDAGIVIPREFNPFAGLWGGGSSDPSQPLNAMNYALVQFTAAAGKHYIVDCMAAGEDFATQVIVNGALAPGGFTYRDGHAIQFIASMSTSNTVRMQLLSGGAWTFRRCEITPVG